MQVKTYKLVRKLSARAKSQIKGLRDYLNIMTQENVNNFLNERKKEREKIRQNYRGYKNIGDQEWIKYKRDKDAIFELEWLYNKEQKRRREEEEIPEEKPKPENYYINKLLKLAEEKNLHLEIEINSHNRCGKSMEFFLSMIKPLPFKYVQDDVISNKIVIIMFYEKPSVSHGFVGSSIDKVAKMVLDKVESSLLAVLAAPL